MRSKKLTPRGFAGVVTVIACAAALVPGTGASAASTFSRVLRDYASDANITPCLFTQTQLKNVRRKLSGDFDAYSPDVRIEVDREIKRWRTGGCSGKASNGLRIVKAKGKGSARKEYVTLKNEGSKQINLRGYALRDRARKKIRFMSVKLGKGRTLRVSTRCAPGTCTASRRGSRYFACKTKQHWNDKGDVVVLLSRSGKVLARRRTT